MKFVLTLLFTVLVPLAALAQGPAAADIDAAASFITKLHSMVSWPDTRSSEGNGKYFVIAAVGEGPLVAKLKEYHRQPANDKVKFKVRIVEAKMIPNNSHLVYIDSDDPAAVKKMLKPLAGTGTLTVTNGQDVADVGAVMNFAPPAPGAKAKVALELNAAAAKTEGLTVNPALLKLVKVIR